MTKKKPAAKIREETLARRRERVGHMLRDQVPIREIAKLLHVSPDTVRADATWLMALWREDLFGTAVDMVRKEDERLCHIEQQLIEEANRLRSVLIQGAERQLAIDCLMEHGHTKAAAALASAEPVIFDTELWLKVIDRRMRIMERRAKMLGLDAPEEASLSVTQVNAVFTQLLAGILHLIGEQPVRESITVVANEVLERYGAGSCLSLPEQPENAT